MPTYRVDHVHLKAVDVEKTARWYVEKLGARITFEGQFRGSKVYYLDTNPLGIFVIVELPFSWERIRRAGSLFL